MISEKKSEILAITESDANSGVEKRKIQGRDLLSVLIKANMARDIPESARMTDEEIRRHELRVAPGHPHGPGIRPEGRPTP